MTKRTGPSADDLSIATAGRFTVLPRPLTGRAVERLFKVVLAQSGAKRVSKEVRVKHGTRNHANVVSFLCLRTNPPVKFLEAANLEETRYGFVLLVERRGYLVVFHHLARGLDQGVRDLSRPVDRQRVTHLWSGQARYQRFSTKRMTISNQELRGASYEADDLETAFVPALASRSILQTLGLSTIDHGVVGITPSTGRIRVSSTKGDLESLLTFIDKTLDGLEGTTDSDFLKAFPSPVDMADSAMDIVPSGLLFDGAQLHRLLEDSSNTVEVLSGDQSPEELLNDFVAVLELHPDGDRWQARDSAGEVVAHVKRLKHSFSIYSEVAERLIIREESGPDTPLDRWVREQDAFSLSFTSTEYFYSGGILFKTGGFTREAALVRRFLKPEASLATATSEKGGHYSGNSTRFAPSSMFRIVEDSLASTQPMLWCGDLGDEWADYIGVGDRTVKFYHCKHGDPTTGASNLQVVTAQALKNLGRVKFRHDEIQTKLQSAVEREYWGNTQIPLLARGPGGWPALRDALVTAASDPMTRWQVSLVVTALSLADFDAEAARNQIRPHFIQLVWLLSAFVSACRERDADPMVLCRP